MLLEGFSYDWFNYGFLVGLNRAFERFIYIFSWDSLMLLEVSSIIIKGLNRALERIQLQFSCDYMSE